MSIRYTNTAHIAAKEAIKASQMNFVLLVMALIFGALNHGAIEMARAFIFSKPPGVRTVSQLIGLFKNSLGWATLLDVWLKDKYKENIIKIKDQTQVIADIASFDGLLSLKSSFTLFQPPEKLSISFLDNFSSGGSWRCFTCWNILPSLDCPSINREVDSDITQKSEEQPSALVLTKTSWQASKLR